MYISKFGSIAAALGAGLKLVLTLLFPSLGCHCLVLSRNALRDDGALELAALLRTGRASCLRALDVGDTGIGPLGSRALLSSLGTLERLSMSKARVDHVSMEQLGISMAANRTLVYLNLDGATPCLPASLRRLAESLERRNSTLREFRWIELNDRRKNSVIQRIANALTKNNRLEALRHAAHGDNISTAPLRRRNPASSSSSSSAISPTTPGSTAIRTHHHIIHHLDDDDDNDDHHLQDHQSFDDDDDEEEEDISSSPSLLLSRYRDLDAHLAHLETGLLKRQQLRS
jgi:hypothetical protein